MTDNQYDVIVVGAGIVGSYFARRCAEGGLKVLLLDRRAREELGGWKNTGHNLDQSVFDTLPIKAPTEEETLARIEKALFKPPYGEPFYFDLPMISVKLKEFTERVNREALDADVDFRDKTRVVEPIVEDGYVRGIIAESGDEKVEFRSAVVADVSGIDAVVREKLPPEFGLPSKLSRLDYLLVYGEDWEIGEEHKFNFTYYPNWQGWSGPRQPGVIGIGLGRFAAREEDPREMFKDFSKEVWPQGGKKVWTTFNRVPLRHPLHSFVANGFVAIGDSAIQGKPLNGEGVSVMMFAAEMAKDEVVKAVKSGDAGAKQLWKYNVKWQREWGARFSVFHRMRYELLRLNSSELDYLFALGMYGPEDMSGIMKDARMEITPGRILRLIKTAAKGLGRPDLLIRLTRATMEGQKLKKLYEQYPSSPEDLSAWIEKVEALYHYK